MHFLRAFETCRHTGRVCPSPAPLRRGDMRTAQGCPPSCKTLISTLLRLKCYICKRFPDGCYLAKSFEDRPPAAPPLYNNVLRAAAADIDATDESAPADCQEDGTRRPAAVESDTGNAIDAHNNSKNAINNNFLSRNPKTLHFFEKKLRKN